MASGLIGIQVPGNRLRVRVPCPPLCTFLAERAAARLLCQNSKAILGLPPLRAATDLSIPSSETGA